MYKISKALHECMHVDMDLIITRQTSKLSKVLDQFEIDI